MNLGVMEMKRYSTLPKSHQLEPHNQILLIVILRTTFFVCVCMWGGGVGERVTHQKRIYYENPSQRKWRLDPGQASASQDKENLQRKKIIHWR